MKNQKERDICIEISKYLSTRGILYRWDIGADIPIPIKQAVRLKRQFQHKRGYPDLFIPIPRNNFHGFYIEIKTNKDQVYTKKYKMRASKHIQEQHLMHQRLRGLGYKVEWGFGLEDSLNKIKEYTTWVNK